MKKNLLFLLLLSINFCFAQETDDLDSLFEEESDIVLEVPGGITSQQENSFSLTNLTFSGNLKTKIGAAYIYDSDLDKKNSATGYMDFKNTLDFSVFPIKDFTAKLTLTTELNSLTGNAAPFNLEQLYFDYLINNYLYVTCGRKYVSWTYSRLFKDQDCLSSDCSFTVKQFDNILFDSSDDVQFMLRVPINTSVFTGLILYSGSSTSPSVDEISYAASAEFVFLNTAINFWGRKTSPNNQLVIQHSTSSFVDGLDIKHTFFDVDAYGQIICSWRGFKHSLNYLTDFDNEHLQSFTATLGSYYLWDKSDPNFGYNIEYQYTVDNDSALEGGNKYSHAIAMDLGIKRLGIQKNIKIGFEGRLELSTIKGYGKLGLIVSNLWPNIDWENGIQYDFAKQSDDSFAHKITIGTLLSMNINY